MFLDLLLSGGNHCLMVFGPEWSGGAGQLGHARDRGTGAGEGAGGRGLGTDGWELMKDFRDGPGCVWVFVGMGGVVGVCVCPTPQLPSTASSSPAPAQHPRGASRRVPGEPGKGLSCTAPPDGRRAGRPPSPAEGGQRRWPPPSRRVSSPAPRASRSQRPRPPLPRAHSWREEGPLGLVPSTGFAAGLREVKPVPGHHPGEEERSA